MRKIFGTLAAVLLLLAAPTGCARTVDGTAVALARDCRPTSGARTTSWIRTDSPTASVVPSTRRPLSRP